MTHDISKFSWSDFAKSGAFLRVSPEEIRVWLGPWKSLPDEVSSAKDPAFSVGWMRFFDASMRFEVAEGGAFQFRTVEFLGALEKELAGIPTMAKTDFLFPVQSSFFESMQNVQGRIQRGEIEKAVPVVIARTKKRPTAVDLSLWLQSLLRLPTRLHIFGFWNSDRGVVGATPEILFSKRGGHLETMALAGTCPRSEVGTRPSLLKDQKELHEHNIVVDDLERQLSRLGWVRKSETQILELPTLLHLMTQLQVETSNRSVRELVQLLHPTPALGVAPRAYGYQWMKNLPDQADRGFHGAPLVFSLGEEEALALVAIRQIQWSPQGSAVGAGCGLVKESFLDREWGELQNKLATIFQSLGLK